VFIDAQDHDAHPIDFRSGWPADGDDLTFAQRLISKAESVGLAISAIYD
jgi:hypothetical protein